MEHLKPRFNWGALFLSPYFAVGNKAWLGLLTLLSVVPIIGWIFAIVWTIVFGFKGEAWATRNNNYRDNQEFRVVMDSWNRAGIVMAILLAISLVLTFMFWGLIVGGILASYGFYDF